MSEQTLGEPGKVTSPEKDALELRKLELELQRGPLELQKLEAEVEEIRSKVRISQTATWLERFKVYPAYLTVVVSIVLAVITFLQYLTQQEREQKFRLSMEMIKLIEQINAREPGDQANAALGLAFYGKQAVPILVENLGIDRKEAVYRAIARSLQTIVSNEEKSADVDYVVVTLRDSADSFLNREMRKAEPSVNTVHGLIMAIGMVGREASIHGKLSEARRSSLKGFLEAAGGRIHASDGISAKEKRMLGDVVNEQLKGLSA